MEKIRLIVRKILIILLVIWMALVFLLSHQNGNSSSSLSRGVANFFANGDTVEAEVIEPVIRKTAHMVEYAIGGMLAYGVLITYPNKTNKSRIIIALTFIILYAISDEVHQSFINSRNGSIGDVLIDTLGGAIGIGAICVIQNAIMTMENKIKEDLKNSYRQ